MAQLAKKHDSEEKQESLDEWARLIFAKFVHIIPTEKFIDAFVKDLVTELKLSVDI